MRKTAKRILISLCAMGIAIMLAGCGSPDSSGNANNSNSDDKKESSSQVYSVEYYTSPAEVGDYRLYVLSRTDEGTRLALEMYESGNKTAPTFFNMSESTMDAIEDIYAKYGMKTWSEHAAKSDIDVADAAEQRVKITRVDGMTFSFGNLDDLTDDEKAALRDIASYIESLVDIN